MADNQIFDYVLHRVSKDEISFSLQKQIVGAIKLFYSEVYKRKIDLKYLYPKRREKKLPEVLSKQAILEILNNTTNLKHKTIIALAYSAG